MDDVGKPAGIWMAFRRGGFGGGASLPNADGRDRRGPVRQCPAWNFFSQSTEDYQRLGIVYKGDEGRSLATAKRGETRGHRAGLYNT